MPGGISRFNKMSIRDLAGRLRGQQVLVRVDFNVGAPDPKTGEIRSDTRIRAALPTLEFLRNEGAVSILLSHNERPGDLVKSLMKKGKTETEAWRETHLALTLSRAAKRLEGLIKQRVFFLTSPDPWDPINSTLLPFVQALPAGGIAILENTRFYAGDEKGDLEFARKIVDATGAQAFVLDGFSVAHRDQASVTGVAKVIREKGGLAVAGHLMQKEIEFLGQKLLENPEHPYVAIMGGAKVADKIKIINRLLELADFLVIGGAMLYPFLLAAGYDAGSDPLSRAPEEMGKDLGEAERLLASWYEKIILPHIVIAEMKTDPPSSIPINLESSTLSTLMGAMRDIEPNHLAELVRERIGSPRTVVWNGPLGAFEKEKGDHTAGTFELLKILSNWAKGGATVIAGGGDSEKAIKAAKKSGVAVDLSHVSTGGGAMLELLEGKELPGIAVLNDR